MKKRYKLGYISNNHSLINNTFMNSNNLNNKYLFNKKSK